MKQKVGTVLMILGTVLVMAALSLLFWNRMEDERAGETSKQILTKIEEEMKKGIEEPRDPYDLTMKEVLIDGYGYIGYLTIPSLDLKLPVMSKWDYERMKIAPCRYAGSTKTDDLVIAAHNYTKHFGSLSKLSVEDRIYFTDMEGRKKSYIVQTMEILPPSAVEEMTSKEYDLTLFTCTYGGQSRIAVRCVEA